MELRSLLCFVTAISLGVGTLVNESNENVHHYRDSSVESNLIDSNVSLVEDELGCSLSLDQSSRCYNDMSDLSNQMEDPCDTSNNSESEIDFDYTQLLTSTPFKRRRCDDLVDSDVSTIVDELGCSLMTENQDSVYSEKESEEGSEVINIEDISCDSQADTSNTQDMENSAIFTDLEQYSNVYAEPCMSNKKMVPSKAKHLEKALDETAVLRSITQSCHCPKRCTEKIDYQLAFNMRRLFWSKSREQRSEQLILTLSYSQKNGKYTYVFLENGDGICIKGYQLLLNLNKNSVTKHKKLAESGTITPYYKIRQSESRIVLCIHWLENYAAMFGDKMPNTKDILLPYRTMKKGVYHSYKTETSSPVSESTFYGVWSKHFPHLKIKKTNTFTQCTKCAFLIAKINNTPSLEGKRVLRKERGYHIQRQMLERKHYYGKKESSRQHPEEFLSLIIDGMDQSKTDLPHFVGRRAKVINPAALMGTHITGVLSHGHNLFMNYVDLLEYAHDPNLTINVLLKSLIKIVKTKGSLPPVLFLQADNCRRENKNKYVFAFLELLVRQRIFREVYFSFLIVGHTHEDIDAAFSKISRTLKKKSAETLPDLLKYIPNVERVGGMYDVKTWFEDSICNVKGTSEPLHYKFVTSGKNVRVYYKGLQHSFWKQLNGRGAFLRRVPSGKPKLLKTDYTKFNLNIDKLKQLIASAEDLFTNKQKHDWWADFIPNIKTYGLQNTPELEWISALPKQPLVPKLQKSSLSLLAPDLKKLLEKESAEPELLCEKATLKASKSKRRRIQKTMTVHKASVKSAAKVRKASVKSAAKVRKASVKSAAKVRKGSVKSAAKVRKGSVKSAAAPVKRKQHKQQPQRAHNRNAGKSQKSQKRPQVKHRQQNSMMIIPVVDDIKKHIWMIIFFYLLDFFVSLTALFVFLFHLLYFIATVEAIVQHVRMLWEVLLRRHIGCQFAYRNSAQIVLCV